MFADRKEAEQARIAYETDRSFRCDRLLAQIGRMIHDFGRTGRDARCVYVGREEIGLLQSSPEIRMQFGDPMTRTTLRLYGIELVEVFKESFLDIG